MEPQTRGHSFLGLFIQRKTWENRQLLDVVVLRVLRRQSSAYYATQPTNCVSAFGDSDISCRSIHVCVYRKEQTRATDRAAVASVWRSLPGVMVPCGCLCIVLSSYCQLFTRDNIPSGNENQASLARPYFPTVWFTRLLWDIHGEGLGLPGARAPIQQFLHWLRFSIFRTISAQERFCCAATTVHNVQLQACGSSLDCDNINLL